jgi:hypothetical protein
LRASDESNAVAGALDSIRADRLANHVERLADDAFEGRETGEPGYNAAARYVAGQLRALGVEPAGSDGWYQNVALREYRIDTDSATFVIHREGQDIALDYRDHFSMPGDAVRASNVLRADVVFVGFGVHAPEFSYSDYDGIDVRGKIVAGFSGAPTVIGGTERAYYASSRTKLKEAVSRGAVGTISLRTRKREKRKAWEDEKNRFGKRPRMTWIDAHGKVAGYFEALQGGAYLSIEGATQLFSGSVLSYADALDAQEAEQLTAVDLGVAVTMSRRTLHSTITSPNVIGIVRGSDPALANEYVVYTAHLDHLGVRGDAEDKVHNGAYDNAMGVAIMIETARAIVAAPPQRSTLFIALTAEEKGLLGSDYFVNNPTVPIGSIVANINVDMPLFLYPIADLVAFGSQHSSLQSLVANCAAQEGFTLSPDPVPEKNLFVRSDQYSFVRKGVPAVYLVPGFTSTDASIDAQPLYRDHMENHYHEPSDDLSRPVDWESALRFARAHTCIGFSIGNAVTRPSWNEGDFFGARYGNEATACCRSTK